MAACAPVEVGGLPATETAEPVIRVGIGLELTQVTVGGGAPLLLGDPDGAGLAEVPEGSTAMLVADPGGVRARLGGVATPSTPALVVRPREAAGLVRMDGREYRGEVVVTRGANGLLAVNALSLEAYVAGVVNAEMGRRPPADREAMHAQAVVSRTVAMRALGRYRIRGYDLVSTIADQAYGGVGSETDLGWEAVRATRGEVLTWNGAIIEGFFHSTCGGRTVAVEDAFSGAPQPYLRSVSDRDPAGQAYCALSPRFRWREEWTGEQLAATLRATGPAIGLERAAAGQVSDVQISARTAAGRVAEIVLVAGRRTYPVAGQNPIRQTLRLPDGGLLRSNQFTIQVSRTGDRIGRVVVSGGGNGHGVGMCQWGAVGRARAGLHYRQILSAYFPGTEIRRFY